MPRCSSILDPFFVKHDSTAQITKVVRNVAANKVRLLLRRIRWTLNVEVYMIGPELQYCHGAKVNEVSIIWSDDGSVWALSDGYLEKKSNFGLRRRHLMVGLKGQVMSTSLLGNGIGSCAQI